MRVAGSEDLRIPLWEEAVHLEKHEVATGTVRVRTVVDSVPVELREELVREHAEIERVPIGTVVETAPDVRREGDTLVIPVIEERLVIRKELVLVEEVRVRLASVTEPVTASATRRVMRAVVERDGETST